jgi:hypothetical protein
MKYAGKDTSASIKYKKDAIKKIIVMIAILMMGMNMNIVRNKMHQTPHFIIAYTISTLLIKISNTIHSI